jgi:hypothetical protein
MRVVFSVLLLVGGSAPAQELKELLQKGHVVLVETDAAGRFTKATAVVHVHRPPQEVWRIVAALAEYKDFMPKMLRSDMKKVGETEFDVIHEIKVPWANSLYTLRYTVDAPARTMRARWVKGDMRASNYEWKVVPYAGGSLVYYANSTRNFSPFAESLDDQQQTLTVGVNVSAALMAAKAVKERAESAAPQAAAP